VKTILGKEPETGCGDEGFCFAPRPLVKKAAAAAPPAKAAIKANLRDDLLGTMFLCMSEIVAI